MMWKSGLLVYSVCFLHCLFWGSATANDGLLPNGNFEEAPQSWAVVGNVIVGQNLLPQWKIDGLVEYISSSDQRNQLQFIIPDNGHAVQLGNNGLISQQIQGLKKGSSYSISFSVSKACGTPVNLNVTVKPYSQVFLIKTVYDSNGWDVYAWGFQAVSEAQEVVLFNPDEDYNNPNCGPLIDGVAIKEIINPPRSKAVKVDLVNDLVTNGNFEDGPHDYLNGSHGILLPPSVLRHSPLPGWTIKSNQPSKYIDSTHFSVPQGHKAVELFSGLDSILSQTVDTVPRRSYRLSFSVGDANNACKGPLMVQATVGNQTFKVPYESKGTGGFKKAEFTFTANFPTTRIAFKSLSSIKKSDNSGNLCGPVVDQVQVLAL